MITLIILLLGGMDFVNFAHYVNDGWLAALLAGWVSLGLIWLHWISLGLTWLHLGSLGFT